MPVKGTICGKNHRPKISIVFDKDVLKTLSIIADEYDQSVSSLVNRMVRSYLERIGRLPKKHGR